MGSAVIDDLYPDRIVPLDQSVKLKFNLSGLPKSSDGYPRSGYATLQISKETMKQIFGTEGTMKINENMEYSELKPDPKDPSKDKWQKISNPLVNA